MSSWSFVLLLARLAGLARIASLIGVAGLTSLTSLASAQPVPAVKASPVRALDNAIQVEQGATCLEQTRIVGHVRMWLGRHVDVTDLKVTLTGDRSLATALTIEIRRGEHRRTRVFGDAPVDCDELHAVVGLAVALAIDATALASVLSLPKDRGHASQDQASPPVLRLAGLASLGSDVLPGISLGLKLDAELALMAWLGARLEVFAHHSRDNTIAGSRGRFDSSLLAGALQLCAGGQLEPNLRLSLCSGPALGALRVDGRGYSPSHSSTGLWLAVQSGVRIELLLGLRWALDLNVISAVITPHFEATRSDGSLLSRAPSATGFVVNFGPAFDF